MMAVLSIGLIKGQTLALPIDFETTPSSVYAFTDFDGGNASVIPNPQSNGINTSGNVGRMIKASGQVWGGSFLSMSNPINFSTNKIFKMKVYSPRVGARVLLKVENASNGGIFFEKEDTSTVANAWEELTFDFTNVNTANSYSNIVLIWDLGVMGDSTSNFTFLFDDIQLLPGGGAPKATVDLPITWNDTANVNYFVNDFGGNSSTITSGPVNTSNIVVRSIKNNSQTWAGTTLASALANPVPFVSGSTTMSAVVYSPDANIPVRLKVEDSTDPSKFVELDVNTTVANAWDTLVWDFSTATPALNFSTVYDRISIFYDFGTLGSGKTYYVDDVVFGTFGSGGPSKSMIDLPIDWDDSTNVDYTTVDFGGNASILDADPANSTNTVLRVTKTQGAQVWAGTSLGAKLASAVPFASGATTVSIVVYSPDASIPVRLKVEDSTDPAIFVETDVNTTVANAWDTLVFDFGSVTPALNFSNTYDLMSVFFDFGTAGTGKVYYLDRVQFGIIQPPPPMKSQIDLPITWDDSARVDYSVADFGGNASILDADPVSSSNIVLKSTKTQGSQTWAGTSLGSSLASAIPFSSGNTTISALVYSPDANIPVRLKVEDHTDPAISVETEATVSTANTWEVLTFDFSNQVTGTAAINFANTYDMISIFYDFGTAGANKDYYVDQVAFGLITNISENLLEEDKLIVYPNPAKNQLNFDLSNLESNSTLSIYNLKGQLVQQVQGQSPSKVNLDISQLNQGMYLIQVQTDNELFSTRFIKQ